MTNNNNDKFEDEIPVRSAGGSFYVVAVATRGFDADGNADKTRKGGIKKLGIKELAPLVPVVMPQSGSLKAPFIFSAADENEVRKLGIMNGESRIMNHELGIRQDLGIDDIFKKREEVEHDVEEKMGKILKQFSIHSASSGQAFNFQFSNMERFKNLLKTRIKGARNNLKLWQALVKKESVGGMGMTDMAADSIVKIVNGVLDGEIEDLGIRKIGEEGEEGEISNSQFLISNKMEEKNFENNLKFEIENKKSNFYAVSRPAGESGKPKIEDIKYKTKLTGPIEEIASLKIKDFRHLSDDPEKAAEIIKNKIDALEEESFAKRVEGIKAWRNSEIYRAYLEMGRRAIEKRGLHADDNADLTRSDNAGERLTKDEFYAIMDLNKRLRF